MGLPLPPKQPKGETNGFITPYGTLHVVSLPPAEIGDLVIVGFYQCQDDMCVYPGGWTELIDGGIPAYKSAWKVIDGTEGQTISILKSKSDVGEGFTIRLPKGFLT